MHKQVVLRVPEHIKPFRENKETVCIDVKISKTIEYLWEHKIETLGCCECGDSERPTVIIGSQYADSDVDAIRRIIESVDSRKWEILQWKLVEVGKEKRD